MQYLKRRAVLKKDEIHNGYQTLMPSLGDWPKVVTDVWIWRMILSLPRGKPWLPFEPWKPF